MSNEITSTSEIAEQEWDGESEPQDVPTDMVATKEPEHKGIEFHVSMRDYTMNDMEALIVEAAARQLVGNHRERALAKAIEDKVIELTNARLTESLQSVTKDIIDQPITPSFGDKKPVTMREFIGLVGREYLTEKVDWEGHSMGERNYSGDRTNRMELIVGRWIAKVFKDEIEKATNAAIRTIQSEIKQKHEALIATELQRVRAAIAKSVGN